MRTICSVCGLLAIAASAPAAEPSPLDALAQLLVQVDDTAFQLDLLRGMHEALDGRRRVAMPKGWPEVYRKLSKSANAEVREKSRLLALIFGDKTALAELRQLVLNAKQEPAERELALRALLQSRADDLVPLLRKLLADSALRAAALRGLGAFDDSATPKLILATYGKLTTAEKQDAVSALATRPAYAVALLAAVESGDVPRTDVSPFVARQIFSFNDAKIKATLRRVWGSVRKTPTEKFNEVKRFKKQLAPARLKDADLGRGRLVFKKSCASCHRLFDDGDRVGPELTGSQRNNLDYVLLNVIDPNAQVARDYQASLIQTADGRVLTGLVRREDDKTLFLQTANEKLAIAKDDIEARKRTTNSMMPEGLFNKLTSEQIRDLVAYLASPSQVPLPAAGGDE